MVDIRNGCMCNFCAVCIGFVNGAEIAEHIDSVKSAVRRAFKNRKVSVCFTDKVEAQSLWVYRINPEIQ